MGSGTMTSRWIWNKIAVLNPKPFPWGYPQVSGLPWGCEQAPLPKTPCGGGTGLGPSSGLDAGLAPRFVFNLTLQPEHLKMENP